MSLRVVALFWRHSRLEKVIEFDNRSIGVVEPFIDELGLGQWCYSLRFDPKNQFLLNYHYVRTMRGSIEVPEIKRRER